MTAAGNRSAAIGRSGGKDRGDENFPVGSWLIARALRPHVHTFYRFARAADDIADAPDLLAGEKLTCLDRMAAVLDGQAADGGSPAADMRESLRQTSVPAIHCHHLLAAFRQDVTKRRYADWTELMDYCRLSAAPVGRYLLDLHGERQTAWPAADALCAALQVINHLQDCGDDYWRLDRVYLPLDILAAEGAQADDLSEPACPAPLRHALDRVLEATQSLVIEARRLPAMLGDRGLKAESAVIIALAERLVTRLKAHDPLAQRVKLGAGSILAATVSGLWQAWGGGGR